jgi:hypothetical protein
VIVDVFTDTPLRGNQLAVFEDGSALSDDQMQRLAREMNVSETVFLLPAQARSPQRTGHRSRVLHDFSPIWSCGAPLRTGLSVRGRLQRYMSLGEQVFGDLHSPSPPGRTSGCPGQDGPGLVRTVGERAHSPRVVGSSAPAPQPSQRLVVEGNKAWKAACEVRKRWVATHLFAPRAAPLFRGPGRVNVGWV